MNYTNIKEEELKNKIATDFFGEFDHTQIIGKIDFAIVPKNIFTEQYLIWAEAKTGNYDIYAMFVQLILTIGKARTFDIYHPPTYLGAFDSHKFAFVPYYQIQDFFYQNDFNWNVVPSNHQTKEFKEVYEKVKNVIDSESLIFNYDDELKEFIRTKFIYDNNNNNKLQIDKNNFISVYIRWRKEVMPYIFLNWDLIKKNTEIIEGDFYLADLLSDDNISLKESLIVLLKSNYYHVVTGENFDYGVVAETFLKIHFRDEQKAHKQFWNKYIRPPKEELWDWMIERRELLVPQDIRERKGSFFTPPEWVELSQKYLADSFGTNWQEEYYIWDCAAGTGNLLVGLTEKNRIFASTIDSQDVKSMHDRIDNGANLLKKNCFQFDFLNDNFDKLPKELKEIINNEERRKKLIIYINPPYAEASTPRNITKTGTNRTGISNKTMIYKGYNESIGTYPLKELYIQFWTRAYKDISDCKIASFSTLKHFNSEKFIKFRAWFLAKFIKGFICPSWTFDNVNGKFPIAFQVWNTSIKKQIKNYNFDVYWAKITNPKLTGGLKYIKEIKKIEKKKVYCYNGDGLIIDWLRNYFDKKNDIIGYLRMIGTDFQTNNKIWITNKLSDNDIKKKLFTTITKNNLIPMSIYIAIRHNLKLTWLNNRDRFLYPNDKWKNDLEFQNNCFTYTLFNNNIQSKYGTNHWIPFTEKEVEAQGLFSSNFMSDFIAGKIKINNGNNLYNNEITLTKIDFSSEAKNVFDAARELWKYYQQQNPNNPYSEFNINASLYDIKEYFQGRDEKTGRMKVKSKNEKYNYLLEKLREALEILAQKIQPKIYEYGFLLE